MKKAFLLLLIIVHTMLMRAQSIDEQSPSVPAVEQEQRSKAEYKSARQFWQDVVDAMPTDEEAWLNLYKATRYSNYSEHSRSIGKDEQQKLDDLVARMNNVLPNSFAWNYCNYLNSNRTDESATYLKKAYSLRPDAAELWDDMLCEAVISGDDKSQQEFATMLSNAHTYSNAEMEYNRNVLGSVEKDGILITHGNVDTYPLLILQQVHNYRKDIKIICLDWYGSKRYVNKVTAQLGLKAGRIRTGEPYSSLENILSGNDKKTIYLALTLPPSVLSPYSSHLYCTGLALKYSRSELQNLTSLEYNWTNIFQRNEVSSAEDLNRNYLVPVLLLRDHYAQLGSEEKRLEMQNLAEEIASRFSLKDKLKEKLN